MQGDVRDFRKMRARVVLVLVYLFATLSSCEDEGREQPELELMEDAAEEHLEQDAFIPPVRWEYVSVRRPDPDWHGGIDAIGVRKASGEYRWSWRLVDSSDVVVVAQDDPLSVVLFPPDSYASWPPGLGECREGGGAYGFRTTTKTIGFGVWGGIEEGDTVVIVLSCWTGTLPSELVVMLHADPLRSNGPSINLQRVQGAFPLMLEYDVPVLSAYP